jgi:AraC-like DNA-binding protein
VSDSYGASFGKRLNARASTFLSRALPKSNIAVTELKYDEPQFILSTPPATEDAFMTGVHLRLFEKYEYWENGKAAPVSTLRPGESIIYDIKRQPTFHLNSPFHSVHFYLPVATLHAIADEAETRRIEELRYDPGVSRADPLLYGLAGSLLPLFRSPERASQVFLDHLMLTVGHHAAREYGGLVPPVLPVTGGLTFAQEQRAKEMLAADLSGRIRLADLARECGLSTSRFSRAFRRSVGTPPHRWLIRRRLEHAKSLLRCADGSLAEIALASGFADQSHFTRCFTSWVGVSPGQWRRTARI